MKNYVKDIAKNALGGKDVPYRERFIEGMFDIERTGIFLYKVYEGVLINDILISSIDRNFNHGLQHTKIINI